MGICYINGEYVDEENAVIPATDMAVLRGYAVFDFFRTYGGVPFHLADHIKRLRRSAGLIGLFFHWSDAEMIQIVLETLDRNTCEEANIRLVVTGGDSLDSITPGANPRLLVLVTEVKPFPREWYTEGIKVVTAEANRYIPEAKSTNYVNAVIALRRAYEKGAIESFYVDENESVREGTTTNLFLVSNRRLITPDAGILPGITRKVILSICDGVFDIIQRSIAKEELKGAEEIFISGSNKQVVPVVQVDDHTIGNGKPGTVTMEIMRRFQEYTKSWGES